MRKIAAAAATMLLTLSANAGGLGDMSAPLQGVSTRTVVGGKAKPSNWTMSWSGSARP